jgi:hypothetical protein
VVNRLCTGTVTVVVWSVEPAVGVKVNVACVMERVGSKPITVTVNPVLEVATLTLEIVGAAAGITIVNVGAGDGVIFVPSGVDKLTVIVIVPATVPVCTPTFVAETVEPAGTVTLVVRPPLAN